MEKSTRQEELETLGIGKSKLANVLKQYRKSHNIVQKQMAAFLGVTREYYASVESGKKFPSTTLLRRICQATKFNDSILSPKIESSEEPDCAICLVLSHDDRVLIKKIVYKLAYR